MKVQGNQSIFMGDDTLRARHDALSGVQTKEKSNSQSIKANNLNTLADPIAAKKKQAQQKAMKLVGDVFNSERKVDESIKARRDKMGEIRNDISRAKSDIKELDRQQDDLNKAYGVTEDSDEARAYELMKKSVGNAFALSDEEKKELAEYKKSGISEYLEQSEELYKRKKSREGEIDELNMEMKVEEEVIRQTKREQLKSHADVDAQKQAQEIMDETAKEITGMLVDEAKEHIDGELDKKKEAADAQKEKKEELEEKIEARKEKEKEQEELTEDILDGVETKNAVTAEMSEAQAEVKDMMSKMNLIEYDVKGAAVDEKL